LRKCIYTRYMHMCVDTFAYYHAWARTPRNVDLDVMSEAIAEVDNVTALVTGRRNNTAPWRLKGQDGGCVSLTAANSVPWSTPHVVSGATFSGHHIFRVTMGSRPNQTGTLSDHTGTVMIVSVDPFTYWQTNVAR
jgi:hypothetical protein